MKTYVFISHFKSASQPLSIEGYSPSTVPLWKGYCSFVTA